MPTCKPKKPLGATPIMVTGTLLPELGVTNPWPIAIGAAAMLGLAALSAYLPARQASGVDPLEALRYE